MQSNIAYFLSQGSCKSFTSVISDCYHEYSREEEDTGPISLPGWKPLPHNTSWPKALNLCPVPWRYQSSVEINNVPIRGTYNSYGGGGYVAVMGYDEQTANRVLNETFRHGWVDRRTRAVILEFAIFNANLNLLSIGTYFYEVLAAGAAFTTRRAETLELYSTDSGSLMFYLICQFLFMVMALYYLAIMLFHLYKQRLRFFMSVWNMVDFFMIVFSVLSMAFYMIRSKSILKSVKTIQANPYDIIHFHAAVSWLNWENGAMAVAIFMVTLKLLNLIRFNPHIIYLFSSFRQSVDVQLSYVGIFVVVFNAFVISGMSLFGRSVGHYSGYMHAVMSQFEFLLGKAVPIDGLRSENEFIGPSFALTYNLTMVIILMNMLVSVLNEAYTDAKTQVDKNAEELEMARFIYDRFTEIIQGSKDRPEFKLFCDEATLGNMCVSDAEPFCLNSESLLRCTEDRLKQIEKRVAVLARRTDKMSDELIKEEDDFLDLVQSRADLTQSDFD